MSKLTYDLCRMHGASVLDRRTYRRADAARYAYLAMVHDMIRAESLLDRPAGRAAMDRASRHQIAAPDDADIWQTTLGDARVTLLASRDAA